MLQLAQPQCQHAEQSYCGLCRMMNVKDFGAKGNGTNATEAFQKAADAVPASGGVLYIPAGQPLRPWHCSINSRKFRHMLARCVMSVHRRRWVPLKMVDFHPLLAPLVVQAPMGSRSAS